MGQGWDWFFQDPGTKPDPSTSCQLGFAEWMESIYSPLQTWLTCAFQKLPFHRAPVPRGPVAQAWSQDWPPHSFTVLQLSGAAPSFSGARPRPRPSPVRLQGKASINTCWYDLGPVRDPPPCPAGLSSNSQQALACWGSWHPSHSTTQDGCPGPQCPVLVDSMALPLPLGPEFQE